MILLISTCKDKLSEEEFVRPIAQVVHSSNIMHYSSITTKDLQKAEKIIICGTAMKDNGFLEDLEKFNWLKSCDKPILGICSGMQIIGLSLGAKLVSKKEIGMNKITTLQKNPLFSGEFEAYCLHGNSLSNLKEFDVLAESVACTQAIKLKGKPVYGIMFHPEVRNASVLEKFLKL